MIKIKTASAMLDENGGKEINMAKQGKDQPAMKERPGLVIWNKALPYIMVAPAMIIFAVFVIYPLFYMIYVSFLTGI